MKKTWYIPIRDKKTYSVLGYWKIGNEIYNKIFQTAEENIEIFKHRKIFVIRENSEIIIHL